MCTKAQAFPETRWSLLGRATAAEESVRHDATSELLGTYLPAMKAFLRGRVPEDMVEDLLHDFMAEKILSGRLLVKADRTRGRFRSYLVKSLQNYARSRLAQVQRVQAMVTVEDVSDLEDDSFRNGISRFDQEWVRLVVGGALDAMQAECAADGRQDLWNVFCFRIVDPLLNGAEPLGYAEIVKRLGSAAPRDAINLLVSAKRRFERHLRETVGRYSGSEEEIEAELRDLRRMVQG